MNTAFHSSSKLHTPLCDALQIKYPLLQAGMGGIAGPELVAKVSEAGGLGILAGTLLPPEELRNRIHKVRSLTAKPFAVNLIWHPALLMPPDVQNMSEDDVVNAQDMLNTFRRTLKIPEVHTAPPKVPQLLHAGLDVILQEKVPVLSIGLGNLPANLVSRCHQAGTKVIAMITTVEDAKIVAEQGVDVIIAQGSEAGGHRSVWQKGATGDDGAIGCMALVPQVVDAVNKPVVAAGGISDGRGMAAALALGAAGVLIGTRFIATKECDAPAFYKTAVLSSNSNQTVITDVFSGAYARVIKNNFTAEYVANGAKPFPAFTQFMATQDIYKATIAQSNPQYYSLWAGQGIGSYNTIPHADELVLNIISEAEKTINKLKLLM